MNIKNFAFWIMMIGIFALGIYLIYFINTQSYQCLANPYTYSMRLLDKANNADVTCICSTNKPNTQVVILDRNGFRQTINPNPLQQTFFTNASYGDSSYHNSNLSDYHYPE